MERKTEPAILGVQGQHTNHCAMAAPRCLIHVVEQIRWVFSDN